jgi:hypothetical protein
MRIIVSSYYDEILVPVMQEVCRRQGWSVCDWFCAYPSRDPAVTPELAFPEASIHRPEHAARGLLPPGFDGVPVPALDQALLTRLAPNESMFMSMLDFYDPDGHAFSGRERRTAYYDLLRMALCVVQAHRPGLMVCATIPHSLHDYMLYSVCKAHGVRTLVYQTASVPGYQVLHDSLEEGSERLRADYRERLARHAGGAVPLPAHMEEYLAKARLDYAQGEPWYTRLRDYSLLGGGGPGPLRRLKTAARFALDFARAPARRYREHFVMPMTDFYKRRGVPLKESTTTPYQAARVRASGLAAKRRLLRQYRELQRRPDLQAPFVFVPLHYQPEASTSPLGGAFADQLLMVRLLARYLPAGWRLYVKEHRSTFDPELRGQFARDAAYYDEILEVPSVTLVPMELASFELIDRARAVAAVTGTAGWEAVVRGVPALVFGNAWYKDCEGVFDARTESGCADAFTRITAGFRPDEARVRLFLQSVAEVGLRADRDNTYILTELTQAESRAATIEHFLREYPRMF